jgi:hypothetical protein
MSIIRPATYLRRSGSSLDGQGRHEQGVRQARCAACLIAFLLLLLSLSGSSYGSQAVDPMAPDFDPIGGSIPGDDFDDTEADGGDEGSDGADQSFDDGVSDPGGPGISEPGSAGGAPRRTTINRAPASTSRRPTTYSTRRTVSQPATSSEDSALTDPALSPSPSPSPSPTPSLTPLSTPTPTPTSIFSGALDEGQKTSGEGSSMLPLLIALLIALGIFWFVWNGRRRSRFGRPGGHRLRR